MSTTANRGGKRAKKMKNHTIVATKEVNRATDDEQAYATIEKVCGNAAFEVKCTRDGKIRHGICRGSLHRQRKHFAVGKVVLITFRDFEERPENIKPKCDIIQLYMDDEVRQLQRAGELDKSIKIDESKMVDEDDVGFDFEAI